jgi:hypothetical protein
VVRDRLRIDNRNVHSENRLQIFVLIDALGWKFVECRDFLSDIAPYRKPLKTVLGFSSGAIPTILTGLPPELNGHWNLFYYDPEGSPFRWLRYFRFFPDCIFDNRVTRKFLKELGRHVLGLGPLFECAVNPRILPWFSWLEKRSIYQRGGISGARSIFDHLVEKGIQYRAYSYHHWTDKEILQQARSDLARTNASFFFLYLSEMDSFLHTYCADTRRLEERLEWYATELRELFGLARELDPDVSFTVFSDHGMTPIQHHYDLVKEVDSLGFSMPKDYLAVYDSTMARFWFFSEQARRDISFRLTQLPCGQILKNEELRRLGIFFVDSRYGELIFLLHPGWLLSRSDFNGPRWMPAGMHGYHPDDADSDAVFLTNRQPQSAMRTIADIYGYMLEMAG